MEIASKASDLLLHFIDKTREQVEMYRHKPIDFHLVRDGDVFIAKFDFGRECIHSVLVQAICGAIANALEPIEHQSLGNLKG